MGSIINKSKSIARKRLAVQSFVLLISNLGFIPMYLGVTLPSLLGVCTPGFYCHGCPWATFACPIGTLVNFSTLRVFPFVTIGLLGIVGTLAGRLVCGWVCPFGLIQDLLYKIKLRKIKLPSQLYYIKYAVLVGLVFAVPYFFPGKPYTFCHFCPSGTLEASIPWQFMGEGSQGGLPAFIMRIGILVGVLLFAVLASRSWCRVLCPLGAIFSLFNKLSIFRFQLTYQKCNNCGVCARKCPVEIDPVKQMNTAECIRCLDCTCTKHIKLGTK